MHSLHVLLRAWGVCFGAACACCPESVMPSAVSGWEHWGVACTGLGHRGVLMCGHDGLWPWGAAG